MNTIRKITSVIVVGLLLVGLVGCSSTASQTRTQSSTVRSSDEQFNSFMASHGIPPGEDAKGVALAICELLDSYSFDAAVAMTIMAAEKNNIPMEDAAVFVVGGVMSYCPEHAADMNEYIDN